MQKSFRIGRIFSLVGILGACLLCSFAHQASAAGKPSFGPIEVKRGNFVGFRQATVKVRVAEAGRVVMWIKGRKHEAHPGESASCGKRPYRWWYITLLGGIKRDPIPSGYLPYLIRATNSAGSDKIVGDRCRPSFWCRPYRTLCSTLSSQRWLKTDSDSPESSRRQTYAMDLQRCGTLLKMTREQLYEFMGTPDSHGKTWSYWDTGADYMGDTTYIEADLRLGRVARVIGAY